MSDAASRLRPARAGDLAAVRALLETSALPSEDLTAAHLAHFLVATGPGKDVDGVVGVEPCGRTGLLRSLAVVPARRGEGLGRELAAAAEGLAARLGIDTLYLLTETAVRFFEGLGYERADRDSVPPPVAATREFTTLCPASATCLRKALRPGRRGG